VTVATRAGDWAGAAGHLVADLGFTLLQSHRPGPSGSHLVVALRRMPTKRHFDPEAIGFYAPSAGRGTMATIDRRGALHPPTRPVLWGHVHVIDRYEIENRFLTFGGTLRAAELSPDLTVVDLVSPGPIVRWGGHSQGTDRLATEIGAFFGRLIVPVDIRPGMEGYVDGLRPEVLYSAFLADVDRRLASERVRGADDELLGWLSIERTRLEADGATWEAGRAALRELALDR
jgi:hypothetical protein